MADNRTNIRHNTNKFAEIVAITEGWAIIVARIIELSNYIRYSISFIVTNMMTAGIEYDRNNPIRSRSSRYSITNHRNCKTRFIKD